MKLHTERRKARSWRAGRDLVSKKSEIAGREGSSHQVGAAAVSYTHLDVYKRQSPYWHAGLCIFPILWEVGIKIAVATEQQGQMVVDLTVLAVDPSFKFGMSLAVHLSLIHI